MQNAYSTQASLEVERQVGERSTVSAGYVTQAGDSSSSSMNQNVPSCVAAGTNNGCRPIATYANNSQYFPDGAFGYQGLHVSFVQRAVAAGAVPRLVHFSKAMANVGEFFFSSPIDPFDLSEGLGPLG